MNLQAKFINCSDSEKFKNNHIDNIKLMIDQDNYRHYYNLVKAS